MNNHPDEVDSKAVLAYGLVNKATIYQIGFCTSKSNVLIYSLQWLARCILVRTTIDSLQKNHGWQEHCPGDDKKYF